MMTTEKAKWTSSAGPIQTKKVVKALGELKRLASSHKEWSGVKPAPGMPDTVPDARDLSTLWSPFGPATFPAALEALDAIEKKYGLIITRENHGDIIAEATIMNPPFERGQDCEHVKHAYGLLKAGGRLVAIMSNGAKSNGDEFTEWLESVGAIVEPLEPGAFKSAFRPTGVNCKLVVIDK